MDNLIVITPTFGTKGESYIADCTDPLIQVLITEPLEGGLEPEFQRLLPEDEQTILKDFAGDRKLDYLSAPAPDDWYVAKLIF